MLHLNCAGSDSNGYQRPSTQSNQPVYIASLAVTLPALEDPIMASSQGEQTTLPKIQ